MVRQRTVRNCQVLSIGFCTISARDRLLADRAEEHFGPDDCHTDVMLREPYAAIFAELFAHLCATRVNYELQPLLSNSLHESPGSAGIPAGVFPSQPSRREGCQRSQA